MARNAHHRCLRFDLQVKAFGLPEIIDEIINSFEDNCQTRQVFQHRKELYAKLIKQTVEQFVYLSTHPDVLNMEENPFVAISYGSVLVVPVKRLIALMDIPRTSAPITRGQKRG